jgi:hypothetical protein
MPSIATRPEASTQQGKPPAPFTSGLRGVMLRLALISQCMLVVGALTLNATEQMQHPATAGTGLLYHWVWLQCIGDLGLVIVGPAMWWALRRDDSLPAAHPDLQGLGLYVGLNKATIARMAFTFLLSVLLTTLLSHQAFLFVLQQGWLPGDMATRAPGMHLTLFNASYGSTVICLGEFVIDRLRWRAARERLATQLHTEAKLKQLQAQLDPHMLFNSLSNLYELILEDPQQARHMLLKLIAFMRGSLSSSRADTHSLADEFRLTEAYLSIMQVRMADRLKVTWSLPEGLADARIPAMILQPLVENAIVHGLEPLSQGGQITVSAHAQGQELTLEVLDESAPGRTHLPTAASANTAATPATQTGEPTRFGLDYVRQRLQALFGVAASLTLTRPDHLNGTLATLKLPLIR